MSFAERLKKLRASEGMTQLTLSQQLYVSLDTVKGWERGSGNPSYDALICLSRLFDVSVDFLVGNSEYQHEEYKDIYETTGLSQKAIRELKKARAAGFGEIETLNAVLESKGHTELLYGIKSYIAPKDRPCVLNYDKETKETSFKPIDKIFLGNNDIAHDMVLDETFLEMVAKEHINKGLEQIKKDNKGR